MLGDHFELARLAARAGAPVLRDVGRLRRKGPGQQTTHFAGVQVLAPVQVVVRYAWSLVVVGWFYVDFWKVVSHKP